MEFIAYWKTWLQTKLNRDEKGAALVEYALLLALIAVVCIFALNALGGSASDKFDSVAQEVSNTP